MFNEGNLAPNFDSQDPLLGADVEATEEELEAGTPVPVVEVPERNDQEEAITVPELLVTPGLRRPLTIVCFSMLVQQLSGVYFQAVVSVTLAHLHYRRQCRYLHCSIHLRWLADRASALPVLYYSNDILSKALPDWGPWISVGITVVNFLMTFAPIVLIDVSFAHLLPRPNCMLTYHGPS